MARPGIRTTYGGLWRFLAVALIAQAVLLLVLWLVVKHALPILDDWMINTALHNLGLK